MAAPDVALLIRATLADAVMLALHNAYFFRRTATPSNLIQSALNWPCYAQAICQR